MFEAHRLHCPAGEELRTDSGCHLPVLLHLWDGRWGLRPLHFSDPLFLQGLFDDGSSLNRDFTNRCDVCRSSVPVAHVVFVRSQLECSLHSSFLCFRTSAFLSSISETRLKFQNGFEGGHSAVK